MDVDKTDATTGAKTGAKADATADTTAGAKSAAARFAWHEVARWEEGLALLISELTERAELAGLPGVAEPTDQPEDRVQTERLHDAGIQDVRTICCEIRDIYKQINPLLDLLCRQTCPQCRDNCCCRAWVWFNFQDMLTVILPALVTETGANITKEDLQQACIQVLDGPVINPVGAPCNMLGPTGCRLPRTARPFICTWYVCSAQKNILAGMEDEAAILDKALSRIKELRRRLSRNYSEAIGAP